MRMLWNTTEQEMKAINPNVTFTAVVDYSSGWTEETNTVDEAIQLLRELVEADGYHVYMRTTKWTHNIGCQTGILHINVMWCDTITGKSYSKTIKANNINYQLIAIYQNRLNKNIT